MRITAGLASLAVPIDAIKPFPGNPRRGRVDQIKDSLQRYGQFQPVVVQKSSGISLCGNHRRKAAKALGWRVIAASMLDVDDETARGGL